mmetsp:Transcript_9091/g.20343  ORF Transcript_9091/g.20343 Transcript_9091/m.20343 type:complete len:505 (-) Transcript_9091:888-2402(-)
MAEPGYASKRGWLTKQGHIFHTWKKRFFVLDEQLLKYYKSSDEGSSSETPNLSELKGCINLLNCKVQAIGPADGESRPNCFRVTPMSNKIFLIQAGDEASRDQWMDVIRENSQPRAGGSGQPPEQPDATVGMEPSALQVPNVGEGDSKVTLGDFELLKVIGRGTYGKVMQVRRKDTGEIFAMKVLKKENIFARNDPKDLQHTIAERNVLALVNNQAHPFILGLKFAFHTPAKLYYVLNFCNGGDLYYLLSRCKKFKEHQARFYAAEVFMALQHLHSLGVIYRDLKPENVLLVTPPASKREPPKDYSVALIDFGGATWESQHHSSVVCTRQYRPPEVTLGLGWDQNVDLWSVGCILVELWTGTVLFSTHDEVEHLALMERILGTLPRRLLRNAVFRRSEKTFRHGCLKWPDRAMDRHSEDFVRSQPRLREIIGGECAEDEERNFEPLRWTEEMGHFYDFIWRLLEYLPEHRMSAEAALRHPFLSAVPPRQQRAIAALRVGDACSS